jgi:hypothetical protein
MWGCNWNACYLSSGFRAFYLHFCTNSAFARICDARGDRGVFYVPEICFGNILNY